MKNYKTLFAMLLISFVVMYGVMFLNVANLNHIYLSTTRFYMTLLMISPMAFFMLLLMWRMFNNKKANFIILTVSVVVFVLSLIGLRTQTPIGDTQYMRAMIPHHSSAILTSENANLTDPEVKELAENIIKTQKEEIAQMKRILNEKSE